MEDTLLQIYQMQEYTFELISNIYQFSIIGFWVIFGAFVFYVFLKAFLR